MGTLVRIQLYAASESEAAAAFRAAFARIAELDDKLSDYKPESEVNRIAQIAVEKPVRVSGDLLTVLLASRKLGEETDGAFDVTLGPVIRLWRQARRDKRPPDDAATREAAARCGYRKLHLDSGESTVMLEQAGMQLDLGGIAKGYAADEALKVLAKLGFRRALVALSGDLALGDPPPGKRGWRVAAGDRVLELANSGVSTSGDTEQHLDSAGIRYSHIIDPTTGAGITGRANVTVVARSGMEADGLATALSIIDAERGARLLERHPGVSAFRASAR